MRNRTGATVQRTVGTAEIERAVPHRAPHRITGKLDDVSIAVAIAQARESCNTLRLDDGQGLRLIVTPQSARWVFRFTSKALGKRRDMGLGSYPRVSLLDARQLTETNRAQLMLGTDPLALQQRNVEADRKAAEASKASAARDKATLETMARAYHKQISGQFRNDKHAAQWLASLENHVFPTLGTRPLGTIKAKELLALLLPLRDSVPETARRVRQRLDAIFEHAMLHELADLNPAKAIVRAMREGKGRREEKHYSALDYADVPSFVAKLRAFDRVGIAAKLALEWTILTGARTGETLGATWSEIDLIKQEWRIPGARMKMGRLHRVPLTARTLAILKEVRPLGDGKGLVFPSPLDGKRQLSNMSMLMALRRLGYGDRTTVHGFRQNLSSWARENTRYRIDTIEAALAHRDEDKVARAYNHSAEYWQERRALAEEWAQFCTTHPADKASTPAVQGNVVPLQRGKSSRHRISP